MSNKKQGRIRRIVACVNACKGIPTDSLEMLAPEHIKEALDMQKAMDETTAPEIHALFERVLCRSKAREALEVLNVGIAEGKSLIDALGKYTKFSTNYGVNQYIELDEKVSELHFEVLSPFLEMLKALPRCNNASPHHRS